MRTAKLIRVLLGVAALAAGLFFLPTAGATADEIDENPQLCLYVAVSTNSGGSWTTVPPWGSECRPPCTGMTQEEPIKVFWIWYKGQACVKGVPSTE